MHENGNGRVGPPTVTQILDYAMRYGVGAIIALYLVYTLATSLTPQYANIAQAQAEVLRTTTEISRAQSELARNQTETTRMLERVLNQLERLQTAPSRSESSLVFTSIGQE